MKYALFTLVALLTLSLSAQTNMRPSTQQLSDVLNGNYSYSDYESGNPIDNHDQIFQGIQSLVSPDSLKANIIRLSAFGTRNSGSDTLSNTTGFGAARNWALSRFQDYSSKNENRLVSGFLKFEADMCGMMEHKDVLAVLPGRNQSNHKIIVIEGHMDSRCDVLCDVNCTAEGVEDNASGTALVMELARVMSAYTFDHTVVFMLTTGEEQGLVGARALADYCADQEINVKAVLNNDVIGGITCGQTSSPPSCPGVNSIDSTQVRLFSIGGLNSSHKQLSRFIKLQYQEELKALVTVPMTITIMTAEDRTGRGGDHIPFRENGFPAMRFTSANEHGDASNGAGYSDRQHTSDDILGADTDNDFIIDSFFVDFNYLARNARINGVAAAVALRNIPTPDFDIRGDGEKEDPQIEVKILNPVAGTTYRVAQRTYSNDWDTLYTTTSGVLNIAPGQSNSYFFSVASMDANGLESLFSEEKPVYQVKLGDQELTTKAKGISLLQNRPNPFDESTFISVVADENYLGKTAEIKIYDLNGKVVKVHSMILADGLNDMHYRHGYGQAGVYIYTLEIEGVLIDKKEMVFAN
jgi:hypothetical protein